MSTQEREGTKLGGLLLAIALPILVSLWWWLAVWWAFGFPPLWVSGTFRIP